MTVPTKSSLVALLFFCAAPTILNAQGYIYTFSGVGASELDGSFIALTGTGVGPFSLSNLSAARILDSYGPGAAFDILAPPNSVSSFGVTSFGSTGFSGGITCEMFGYLGAPSVVVLSGNPARISYSQNLFFPGNPLGGAISGTWSAATVPEPDTLAIMILGVAAFCGCRRLRRKCCGN